MSAASSNALAERILVDGDASSLNSEVSHIISPHSSPDAASPATSSSSSSSSSSAVWWWSSFRFPLPVDLVQHNIRSPLLTFLTFLFLIGTSLLFFILLFVFSPDESLVLAWVTTPPTRFNFTKTFPPFRVHAAHKNWQLAENKVVSARLIPSRPFGVDYTTPYGQRAPYAVVDCASYEVSSTRATPSSSSASALHDNVWSDLDKTYCGTAVNATRGFTARSDSSGIATFDDFRFVFGFPDIPYRLEISCGDAVVLTHTISFEVPLINLTSSVWDGDVLMPPSRRRRSSGGGEDNNNPLYFVKRSYVKASFSILNMDWSPAEFSDFANQSSTLVTQLFSFDTPVRGDAAPARVQEGIMRRTRWLKISRQSCGFVEWKCEKQQQQMTMKRPSVCHAKIECGFDVHGGSSDRASVALTMFGTSIVLTRNRANYVAPIEVSDPGGEKYWYARRLHLDFVDAYSFNNGLRTRDRFWWNESAPRDATGSLIREGEPFSLSVSVYAKTSEVDGKKIGISGTQVVLSSVFQPPIAYGSADVFSKQPTKVIVNNKSTLSAGINGTATFHNAFFSVTGAVGVYRLYAKVPRDGYDWFPISITVYSSVVGYCAESPRPLALVSNATRDKFKNFCMRYDVDVVLGADAVPTIKRPLLFYIFNHKGEPVPGKLLFINSGANIGVVLESTRADSNGVAYVSHLTVTSINNNDNNNNKRIRNATVPVYCDGQIVGHLHLRISPPTAVQRRAAEKCPAILAQPMSDYAVVRPHRIYSGECCSPKQAAWSYKQNSTVLPLDAMSVNVSLYDPLTMQPTTLDRLDHKYRAISCCLGSGADAARTSPRHCQDFAVSSADRQRPWFIVRGVSFSHVPVDYFPDGSRRVAITNIFCKLAQGDDGGCGAAKSLSTPLWGTVSFSNIRTFFVDDPNSMTWQGSSLLAPSQLDNLFNKNNNNNNDNNNEDEGDEEKLSSGTGGGGGGGGVSLHYKITSLLDLATDPKIMLAIPLGLVDQMPRTILPECSFNYFSWAYGPGESVGLRKIECDSRPDFLTNFGCYALLLRAGNGDEQVFWDSVKCPTHDDYTPFLRDAAFFYNHSLIRFSYSFYGVYFYEIQIYNSSSYYYLPGSLFAPVIAAFLFNSSTGEYDYKRLLPSCLAEATPDCVLLFGGAGGTPQVPLELSREGSMSASFWFASEFPAAAALGADFVGKRYNFAMVLVAPGSQPGDNQFVQFVTSHGRHQVTIPNGFVENVQLDFSGDLAPRVVVPPPSLVAHESAFDVRVEWGGDSDGVLRFENGGLFKVECVQLNADGSDSGVAFPCYSAPSRSSTTILSWLSDIDNYGLRISRLRFPRGTPSQRSYRIDVQILGNRGERDRFSVGRTFLVSSTERCRVLSGAGWSLPSTLLVGRPVVVPLSVACRGRSAPNMGVRARMRTVDLSCVGPTCGYLLPETSFAFTDERGLANLTLVPLAAKLGTLVVVEVELVPYFEEAVKISLMQVTGVAAPLLDFVKSSEAPVARLFDDFRSFFDGDFFPTLQMGPVQLINDVAVVNISTQPRTKKCEKEEEEDQEGEKQEEQSNNNNKENENNNAEEEEEEEGSACSPFTQQPVVRVLGADGDGLPRKWVRWLLLSASTRLPLAGMARCRGCQEGSWTDSEGYAEFDFEPLRPTHTGNFTLKFYCQGVASNDSVNFKIQSKEEAELFEAKEKAEQLSLALIGLLLPIVWFNTSGSSSLVRLFAAIFAITFVAVAPMVIREHFASQLDDKPFLFAQAVAMYTVAAVATAIIVVFTFVSFISPKISRLRVIDGEGRALRALRYTSWTLRWRPRLPPDHHHTHLSHNHDHHRAEQHLELPPRAQQQQQQEAEHEAGGRVLQQLQQAAEAAATARSLRENKSESNQENRSNIIDNELVYPVSTKNLKQKAPIATRQEMFDLETYHEEHLTRRQRLCHELAHQVEHKCAEYDCAVLGENLAEAMMGEGDEEEEGEALDPATWQPQAPYAPLSLAPALPPRLYIFIAFALAMLLVLMWATFFLLTVLRRWVKLAALYLVDEPILSSDASQLFSTFYIAGSEAVIHALKRSNENSQGNNINNNNDIKINHNQRNDATNDGSAANVRNLRQLFPLFMFSGLVSIINGLHHLVSALHTWIDIIGPLALAVGVLSTIATVYFTVRSVYRAQQRCRRGQLPGQRTAELEEADEYVGMHAVSVTLSYLLAVIVTVFLSASAIFVVNHFNMIWNAVGSLVEFLGIVFLCETVAGRLVNYWCRSGLRYMHPRIALTWSFVAGVLSVFSAVITLIVRMFKYLLVLGLYFSRFDLSLFPSSQLTKTYLVDNCHASFTSLVAVDCAYNHPVMHCFLGLVSAISFLLRRASNTDARRPTHGVGTRRLATGRRRGADLVLRGAAGGRGDNENDERNYAGYSAPHLHRARGGGGGGADDQSELDTLAGDGNENGEEDNNNNNAPNAGGGARSGGSGDAGENANENRNEKRYENRFLVDISAVGRDVDDFPRVQNQLRATLAWLARLVSHRRYDDTAADAGPSSMLRVVFEHIVVSSPEVDEAIAGVVIDGDELLSTAFGGATAARRRIVRRWWLWVVLTQNPSLIKHRKHNLLRMSHHHGGHEHHVEQQDDDETEEHRDHEPLEATSDYQQAEA